MTKNFTNAPISPLPPAYWRALLEAVADFFPARLRDDRFGQSAEE
jgi:hypothetical protein